MYFRIFWNLFLNVTVLKGNRFVVNILGKSKNLAQYMKFDIVKFEYSVLDPSRIEVGKVCGYLSILWYVLRSTKV